MSQSNPLVLFLFAILLPPLTVWLGQRQRGQTMVNVLLCVLGWLPGVIHAIMVTNRRLHRERAQ